MSNTLAYLTEASNNKLECFSLTNLSAKTNFMKKVFQVMRRSLTIATNFKLARNGFQMTNTLAFLSEASNDKLECFSLTNLSAKKNVLKKVLQVKRGSLAIITNIRQGRKRWQMANTLAYLSETGNKLAGIFYNWRDFLV
jgi:hypothetical protein